MLQKVHEMVHGLHSPDIGILFIRIALGAVFVYHGWGKVSAMDQAVGFFASIGIGAFWTYVAACVEFLGGIALLLGIFVRYAGILLAIMMAVAIFKVRWVNGFSMANGGYEFELTLLLGSAALVTLGAGKYSLAGMIKKQENWLVIENPKI